MSVIVYAIKTRQGDLALPTIRATKRKCIADYAALPGNREATWRQLRRWGWSCVPVRITAIQGDQR